MKKVIIYAIVLSILSLTLAGCAVRKDSPVLPPTRWGTKGTFDVQLEMAYGFESAFADADMVAHVRVGDWIDEDTDIYATYYEATVLHSYKGEETGNFVLTQDGCSEYTMGGYPLS